MFGKRKKDKQNQQAAEPEIINIIEKPEDIIAFDNVTFTYEFVADEEETSSKKGSDKDKLDNSGTDNGRDNIRYIRALSGISLKVKRGEFLAVIGRNGSGKSTLAKLMNALEIPSEGTVVVDGIDTSGDDIEWEVRSRVGMVFQNPDNQIIGATVEEDVAFGLENLGVPREDMIPRIDEATKTAGLEGLEKSEPRNLSGGQKQRVAIAGIIAMRPECIVLDEATAMLDPVGRREVMKVASELNKEHGITIVHITHHMDEVARCDRAIVIENGQAVMEGTPRELFSRPDEMRRYGLEVPAVTALADSLKKNGFDLPDSIINVPEALEALTALIKNKAEARNSSEEAMRVREAARAEAKHPYVFREGRNSVEAAGVSYTYNPKSPFEKKAIEDVSFKIGDGEFLGIIGHTGCGKSTLVQHLNGLLKPDEGGNIIIGGEKMMDANVKTMRRRVGLVFQYPEYQLFEATVAKDVAFGIRNDGLSEEETAARVDDALKMVGLDPKEVREKSIYDLSGGQKRRVAIAGILVMQPGILVLDEPAAGLDPAGREEILGICRRLNRENGNTVILVSHSMEDVARLCDRILVMNHGRVNMFDVPEAVFENEDELVDMGLAAPELARLFHRLNEALPDIHISRKIYTTDDAVNEILSVCGIAVNDDVRAGTSEAENSGTEVAGS